LNADYSCCVPFPAGWRGYLALIQRQRVLGTARNHGALFLSQRGVEAKKAQGVKLGGLNAKGIQNRDEAKERAEQLRPIFTELAGRSARAIATALKAARKLKSPIIVAFAATCRAVRLVP
jgi:hypothetical protein